MMQPTFVSLFAGAGGFDIGFDRAGFRCLAQVEIDATARSVLARHWPDVPRYEDVRKFGKEHVSYADVVVGGFPCQDVSTAGKRAGFEGGERSSLWFEMVRVIRELRPLFVVWENVPGLLSADEGRAFGWVLRELADLGFDGGWRTYDAQFFGVPQQRRRVFGCFARGDSGAERCAEILALTEGVRRRTPPRRKAGPGTAAATEASIGSGRPVANCLRGDNPHNASDPAVEAGMLAVFGGGSTSGERGVCAALSAKAGTRQDFDTENFVLIQDARDMQKSQNGGGGKPSEGYPAALVGPRVRRLTPLECERLMGWPSDWTRYRADGKQIADGPRYRLCGNGVVGTVSEWLARCMMCVMQQRGAA